VISQLEKLPTPTGVDEDLFALIKEEFRRSLEQTGGKTVLNPPIDDLSKVTDLQAQQDGLKVTLTWSYKNAADYNQDGMADIADIATVAEHFFHTSSAQGGVPNDPFDDIVDGNDDGTVDIADVALLAENFFVEVASYHVQGAEPSPDNFEDIGVVNMSEATGGDVGRKRFSFVIDNIGALRRFRVVPADSQGNLGIESNTKSVSADPPEITDVNPKTGVEGSTVTFTASLLKGTPPLSYNWDFGGGANPNTSTDASPIVTLGTPGTYNGFVEISNAFTTSPVRFDFSYEVTPQAPPFQITGVRPTSARANKEVNFNVDVVGGSGDFTYAWDFDGGVVPPSTSNQRSPTKITTSTPGVYDCSVTVTDNQTSESVTYQWQLTVTSGNNAPTVTLRIVGDQAIAEANDLDGDPLSFSFAVSPIASTVRVYPKYIDFTTQYTQSTKVTNLSLSEASAIIGVTVTDTPTGLQATDQKSGTFGPPPPPPSGNAIWMYTTTNTCKVGEEIDALVIVYQTAQTIGQLPNMAFDFGPQLDVDLSETLDMGALLPGPFPYSADGLWGRFGVDTIGPAPPDNWQQAYDNFVFTGLEYTVDGEAPPPGTKMVWMAGALSPTLQSPNDQPAGTSGEIFNFKFTAVSPGVARVRFIKTLVWTINGQPFDTCYYQRWVDPQEPIPPPRFFSLYHDFTITVQP